MGIQGSAFPQYCLPRRWGTEWPRKPVDGLAALIPRRWADEADVTGAGAGARFPADALGKAGRPSISLSLSLSLSLFFTMLWR